MDDATVRRLTGPGSPFELHRIDVPGQGEVDAFARPPHRLAEIYDRARRTPDKVFLVADDGVLTYGGLFAEADAVKERLAGAGAEAGDLIALALPSSQSWVVAFVAATDLGLVPVLLDPAQEADLARLQLAIAWRIGADLSVDKIADAPAVDTELAFVALTSGSTGKPKGVLVTHQAILTGLRGMMLGAAVYRAPPGGPAPAPAPPRAIVTAPLNHVSGLSQILFAMMMLSSLYLPKAGGEIDYGRILKDFDITSLGGITPVALADLIAAGAIGPHLTKLGGVSLQGSLIAQKYIADLKAVLPHARVFGGYGLTETNGAIATALEEDLISQPGAVNIFPTVQVRVVGEDGSVLPMGQLGEIEVKGAMLCRGYAAPDVLEFRDGWMPTGDLGRLTDARRLVIFDRKSNTATVGGDLVSCGHIELKALAHPAVREAVAVPKDGGIELRVVKSSDVDEDGVRTWVGAEGLSVVFEESLARTASGKMARR